MARGGEPARDDLGEFLGGQAGMGGRQNLQKSGFAQRRQRLAIILEHGLERLLLFPFRVLGGQRLDPIDGKHDLDVHRLLGPQRAIVVEGGNALVGRYEIGAALGRDARDEIGDGLFHRAVIPGGEGIDWRLRISAAEPAEAGNQHDRLQDAPEARTNGMHREFSPGTSLICRTRVVGEPIHIIEIASRPLYRDSLPALTMQRNPTWLVDVSTGCAWRAAGR
jgi:hypothetical protein